MKNSTGFTLFISGIVSIALALIIGGILLTSVHYTPFSQALDRRLALVFWFFGISFGLLLIGLSEVIRLLNDSRLSQSGERTSSNENSPPKTDDIQLISGRTEYEKIIPAAQKGILENYLKEHGIAYNELFDTPFEKMILVGSNGRYSFVRIKGRDPIIFEKKDWNEVMLKWFSDEFGE